MSDSPKITVYSLEVCPNCEKLKNFLKSHDVAYDELDMASPENMTELRMNNVFVREAPVLQIGDDEFLTSRDLFSGGQLREDEILAHCKGD
ncbi:MAG: glutaredoxin family protein [Methanomicrobium sp.]|nr:glutaredoxin family protein [Methanomicrobium sp.]